MSEFSKKVLEACGRGGKIALCGHKFAFEEVLNFWIELKYYIGHNQNKYQSEFECNTLNLWWNHLVICRVKQSDSSILKSEFPFVFRPMVEYTKVLGEVEGNKPTTLDKEEIQSDIRNRLTPLLNLVTMVEGVIAIPVSLGALTDLIKKEVEQCKIEIKKLSNYFKDERSIGKVIQDRVNELVEDTKTPLTENLCIFINKNTSTRLQDEFLGTISQSDGDRGQINTFQGLKVVVNDSLGDGDVLIGRWFKNIE